MRLPSLLSATLFSLLLAVTLTACAAPSASPEALGPALPEQSPSPEPATAARPPTDSPKPIVSRAPSRVAAGGAALDYSCSSDSDCEVKNVGNCCGYYPACVNKDSQTDPEAVRAECQKEGRAGVCGFPSINSCQCVQGRCEGSSQMLPAL
jgi:hypothetical protein